MKHIAKHLLVFSLLASGAVFADVKFLEDRKDQSGYQARQDLAYIEAAAPLSRADRAALTAETLKGYSQEQLDQLYARLGSGPMLEGDYKGFVIIKNPLIYPAAGKLLNKATENGLMGFIIKIALAGICQKNDPFECLSEIAWSGKRFYKNDKMNGVQVRNAVTPNIRIKFLLDKAGLGSLAKPLEKAKMDKFNGHDKLMLFPAHAYCGISLYDTRRESVIVDYAYGDDFVPYIPEIDSVFTRNGSWLRDEIRMIRPGLYLGRAYIDRIFLLNFVLENKSDVATVNYQGDTQKSGLFDWLLGKAHEEVPADVAWKNDCWESDSWQ